MKTKYLETSALFASKFINAPLMYKAAVVTASAFSAAVILGAGPAQAADEDINADSLLNLSLAELTEIEVTSVSKREEKQSEAAAAIFTITEEDIKRSGATAIPELLRMAPGITVTKAGASSWTVTSRGSNDQFSNKLLVLMDGRTIYSPLFSGVIWDVQDTMIEDIKQIEVIRGPGATLWGANAVNGVINIITKHASETQGGLASAMAGNRIKGIGSVRYGGKIGEESYYRAYAKQTEYDHEYLVTGGSANDDWGKSQFGFRTDSTLTEKDTLNIQGDMYTVDEDANFAVPDLTAPPTYTSAANGIKARGANIMSTWEHSYSEDSIASLQAYVDYTEYKTTFFNDETTTFDLDAQHIWSGWEGHDIVWGAGYRLVLSKNDPQSIIYALNPQQRSDNLFSFFVQDTMTLSDEHNVFLTLGTKLENNDYTGWEVQPSARMSWLIDEDQTLWGSVSRAVHTPFRFSSDVNQIASATLLPGPTPAYVRIVGDTNLNSEDLIAYELGYRIQPTKSISLDVATFYNEYDNLFYTSFGAPTTFLPIVSDNSGSSNSYGLEVSGKWNISYDWYVAGTYSRINENFDKKDSITVNFVGKTPKDQFSIRSHYQISDDLNMDNALYYADALSSISVKEYYRLDSMLTYEYNDNVSFQLVGQNLLQSRHQEFSPFQYRSAAEIGRSVYGNIKVNF